MFSVIECPGNILVPIIRSVINSCPLTKISFFLSLEVNKTGGKNLATCHVSEKRERTKR